LKSRSVGEPGFMAERFWRLLTFYLFQGYVLHFLWKADKKLFRICLNIASTIK
jgi:hypothetical protein